MSAVSQSLRPRSAKWPAAVWAAPLFSVLDERGRRELEAAGRTRELSRGERLFVRGGVADSFFIVDDGSLILEAENAQARIVRRGQTLGEEALLRGGRWATASAQEAARIIELPVRLFERAVSRCGGSQALERTRRILLRALANERLSGLAFTRRLPAAELERVLDSAEVLQAERGQQLCTAGEPASALVIVLDGLVQVESEDAGRVAVQAYLAPGDAYGLAEALAGQSYALSAVALGTCGYLRLPAALVRDIRVRCPDAVAELERAGEERRTRQLAARVKLASAGTEHAFQGIERLELARSLLVIEPESCVRCGHCTWACAETHGVPRLERRGEFVLTELLSLDRPQGTARLLLPNACQHCRSPECLGVCPTGAIGIGSSGAVLIRQELCTGCGACAKACPWDSIWMAPRAELSSGQAALGPQEVAVKCDLCNDYAGPACVQACPTEAIQRLEPRHAFAEVGAVLGRAQAARPAEARPARRPRVAIGAPLTIAGAAVAWYLARTGAIGARDGLGILLGWAAAVACVLALAYVAPKRGVRR
ncbi:MAG TPA: cyclic nucleotide-binding domain-containing protein, partial [Polyangiaceae bacterium]|nr:cyclic nucleotide-binding domain-containing protein [Polyangiaceae bacterium]